MTTFEHAMIGINGAFACGLHQRYGWQVIAFAGIAAVSPDWDGLTLLAGMSTFDRAHRVWGHNLLVVILLSAFLAGLDYRYDLTTRLARFAARLSGRDVDRWQLREADERTGQGWLVWATVGILAAAAHLPADLVYSGGYGLSDWELQIFWPFSTRGFVYPMVPWGDPGVTLVFVAGMFAMVRRPSRTRLLAIGTLALMIAYVGLRGALR